MKNINIKISLWFVSLIFIMSISNYINAQTECDSLIKVIICDPPFGPPNVNPPVIADPPLGDPDQLGPEDGEEYIELYKNGYQRDVFYVHGLEGNSSSWDAVVPWAAHGNDSKGFRPDPNFFGWIIETSTPAYDQNQTSLYAAADELDDFIDYQSKTDILPNDNFIIAHSMGGLVSRQMDKNLSLPGEHDKQYGGIITFGTPHQGSPAATYLYDKKYLLKNVIRRSCLDLARGPADELQMFNSNKFLELLGNTNLFNLSDLVISVCQDPESFTNLADLMFSPIVEDLIPGNPVLNEINSYSDPDITKMAFYGVENDEIGQMTWSTFYSLRNGVNSVGLFAAGDNDDQTAKQEMINTQNKYSGRYELWNTVYNLYNIFPTCLPFSFNFRAVPVDKDGNGIFDDWKCIKKSKIRTLRDEFKDGRDYSYELNDMWKGIIGTYNYQVNGYGCQYWVDETTLEVMPVSDPNDCLAFGEDLFGILEYSQSTADESDGIVLKSSAEAFPGVNYLPQKMDGSNHFQMRNDENTEDAMRGIFEGGYLWWFWTPKR